MESILLKKPASALLSHHVALPGSKSISNRALIIRALSDGGFAISNLSSAQDTRCLRRLLGCDETVLDTGPAGTTFRFLTAYLSLQRQDYILTGSERMKRRPIGVLVEALRQLGANIEYLEKEGYPPLRIHPSSMLKDDASGESPQVEMAANISSQFISALLMVAPVLPNGLRIRFKGRPVSMPYILMTLEMMAYFGAEYEIGEVGIGVKTGKYSPRPFPVEADWSAASYHYAFAALSERADIMVDGLFEDSLQGDRVMAEMGRAFGLETEYTETGIRIRKTSGPVCRHFEYDFTACPDIAQTAAVMCAGLGISARFRGLRTLRIKETDRIAALKTELAKVGVTVTPFETANGGTGMEISGRAKVYRPTFSSYEDHRMAMALAPLALLGDVRIEAPDVVGKSYPGYWMDVEGYL